MADFTVRASLPGGAEAVVDVRKRATVDDVKARACARAA